MAYSSDPWATDTPASTNDQQSGTWAPTLPSIPALPTYPGPTDVNSGGYPGAASAMNQPGYSPFATPGTVGAAQTTGGTSAQPPANQFDWSKFMQSMQPDPIWGQISQQFTNWYEQNQWPQQYGLMQSELSGMMDGQPTLPAQLQSSQIGLANNQADMQNALATAGLTGMYGGTPTLQANALMNQYGLAGVNQMLQQQGNQVQFGNTLGGIASGVENADVAMAQIQAQLAQSPLVAWYTARGLPPPASAIQQAVGPDLAKTLQTLGMGSGLGSLQQVQPWQSQWNLSSQGPPVQPLSPQQKQVTGLNYGDIYGKALQAAKGMTSPDQMNAYLASLGVPLSAAQQLTGQVGAQHAQTGKWMDPTAWENTLAGDVTNYNNQQWGGAFAPQQQGNTSTGYASPQGTGGTLSNYFAMAGNQPSGTVVNGQFVPYPTAPTSTDPTGQAAAPMSYGAAPWAQSLASGNPMTSIVGLDTMPSSQAYAALSPTERTAVQQLNQSVYGLSPQDFAQQMALQAPPWASVGPAAYQGAY